MNFFPCILFFYTKIIALYASGANVNDAILRGLDLISRPEYTQDGEKSSNIYFVTDGEATSGITSSDRILDNVRQANQRNVALHCLALGNSVDIPFLKKLSLQNHGFLHHVYADDRVAAEFEAFYDQIKFAALSNIQLHYSSGLTQQTSLVGNSERVYMNGGELVSGGQLRNTVPRQMSVRLSATSSTGSTNINFRSTVQAESGVIGYPDKNITQKIWAYMKIKDFLEKSIASESETDSSMYKARALEFSEQVSPSSFHKVMKLIQQSLSL